MIDTSKIANKFFVCETSFNAGSGKVTSKKAAASIVVVNKVLDGSRVSASVETWRTPSVELANQLRAEATALVKESGEPWGKQHLVHHSAVNKLQDGINELSAKLEPLKRSIKSEISTRREQDRVGLGDLYDAGAYPTDAQIDRKFNISIKLTKVPEECDARSTWTNVMISLYKESIKKQTEESVNDAMISVVHKSMERLNRVIDRMDKYDGSRVGRFTDDLIKNMNEELDNMERYNILDSPEIEAIIKEGREKVCKYTPEQLRVVDSFREEVGSEGRKLKSRLGAFAATQLNS